MGHYRGSKILVYKMKTKKKYRRKKGHRQELTKLKVNTIEV
jgi:large subunit ribosomal protein L21